MTKEEMGRIISALATNYKTEFKDATSVENTAMLWNQFLADYTYDEVSLAVSKHMIDCTFPPRVSDIFKQLKTVIGGQHKTADEAWGSVLKAIGNYGYTRQKEAMASLDDVTRKIVEGMGYLSLCRADTNNGYDRAQFVKMYERNIERIQAEQVTPSFIKKRLELVQAERLMLE